MLLQRTVGRFRPCMMNSGSLAFSRSLQGVNYDMPASVMTGLTGSRSTQVNWCCESLKKRSFHSFSYLLKSEDSRSGQIPVVDKNIPVDKDFTEDNYTFVEEDALVDEDIALDEDFTVDKNVLVDEDASINEDVEPVEFVDAVFSEKKRSDPLASLLYWDLYPKKVKKWVMYAQSPTGYYNFEGRWINFFEKDAALKAESNGKTAEQPESEARKPKVKSKKVIPKESGMSIEEVEQIFNEEQQRLPTELRGWFRFGVEYDQIKDMNPKIRRLFSLHFATPHEILQVKKRIAIQKWKLHEFDTASDPIQIDILTQRIRFLENHLKKNRQDESNKRALQKLIKRRKSLMLHLKKRDPATYFAVLREIKLKDSYHVWDMRVH